jgi:glucosylceramidase
LVNAGSNKCLDVIGNSTADGARLQIWTCTGGANQRWTVPA